ncbi:hypothetical protein GOODEAATRI_025154 [Goodea atripinnis]|uniref:Uncharacterized protein n=1 Tax=Goodea atripinnis TaxID=208336 RepID=A0ABV0NN31_9TELE
MMIIKQAEKQTFSPKLTAGVQSEKKLQSSEGVAGQILHNVGAAVYWQVFTLCSRLLKRKGRAQGLTESMNDTSTDFGEAGVAERERNDGKQLCREQGSTSLWP